MKFVVSQLSHFISDRELRRNTGALVKYVVFLLAVVATYSVAFHVIMIQHEGQQHSWLTGVYWTLTTMSTLGFGDITFTTDLGRAFSMLVLLSGVVLLLIVLPFLFIRYFYAPWIEARVRWQAPREVPEGVRGHVILCAYDDVAPGLVAKLGLENIPYYVIEPDPATALRMHGEGISVVTGEVDSRHTYEALRILDARMLIANRSDQINTNITLTVREVAPEVPITAIVAHPDSVDILELSGATHVLPLKQRLGEQLAIRVEAGAVRSHVIGGYRDLSIAEFAVHDTPLAGKTVIEARLRDIAGVNVVGVWERGRLLPAHASSRFTDQSVPVVIGTTEQLEALDRHLATFGGNPFPVLIVGGGEVGRSAARMLRRDGIQVHMIERDATLERRIGDAVDQLYVGDANDRELLMEAGLAEAPSLLLTTNDDAMNIYLAIYCRKLNPDLRIVSRITHERNLEAIHRAGADLVLGHASLGVATVISLLHGRKAVVIGEGVDLHFVTLPPALVGMTLAESAIGAETGLNVIAVQRRDEVTTNPPASLKLTAGSELVMVGSAAQMQRFALHVAQLARRKAA